MSVVEGAGLEGVENPLELGGTGGTTSLQGRAELPGAGMEGAGEAVCGSRVGERAQTSGAAGEESSGAVITSKGVSSFPVKEFPLFLSKLQHSRAELCCHSEAGRGGRAICKGAGSHGGCGVL